MDRAKFYAAIRGPGRLFPALNPTQVKGMEAILDTWEKNPRDFADPRHLAYALATAYHETAQTMQPIAEYGKGEHKDYGNPAGPYNQRYFGRGLVQLTWLDNYIKAEHGLSDLGIKLDLVRMPDLALTPTGSTQILLYGMTQGWFTGMKFTNFFNHNASDPLHARRIINRMDCAGKIAQHHVEFFEDIKAAKL